MQSVVQRNDDILDFVIHGVPPENNDGFHAKMKLSTDLCIRAVGLVLVGNVGSGPQ